MRPLQFRQPCLRPKIFKNIVLKGHQIISLPAAPTRPMPSLSIDEMKVPFFTKYKTNIHTFKHTSLNNRKTKDMCQESVLILFFQNSMWKEQLHVSMLLYFNHLRMSLIDQLYPSSKFLPLFLYHWVPYLLLHFSTNGHFEVNGNFM